MYLVGLDIENITIILILLLISKNNRTYLPISDISSHSSWRKEP